MNGGTRGEVLNKTRDIGGILATSVLRRPCPGRDRRGGRRTNEGRHVRQRSISTKKKDMPKQQDLREGSEATKSFPERGWKGVSILASSRG